MSDVLSRERALDLKIVFHRLGIASPKDQGIKGHNEKKKNQKYNKNHSIYSFFELRECILWPFSNEPSSTI